MYFVPHSPPSKRSCCNYFRLSQSWEAKKLITVSLGTEHFLKVKLFVRDLATQEAKIVFLFTNLQRSCEALMLGQWWGGVKKKKKKSFSLPLLWLRVFIFLQLRVEAISLPPLVFCCLPAGLPFTKTPSTASGWLKRSQTTQSRYTLTGLWLAIWRLTFRFVSVLLNRYQKKAPKN